MWKDEDGIIYLAYEGSGDDRKGHVYLAVSFDDGKTWKKEGYLVDGYYGTPDFYKKDGVWYLTFHGCPEWGPKYNKGNSTCQIGVAYGDNLRNLTVLDYPVIPTEKDTLWSGTTGRRDVFKCGEYYYMVYEISTESVPEVGYGGAYWSHMFARSKDMINWEITEGPQLPQDTPSFGNDGTNWIVIDGELYVFMRNRGNNTTAVKLEYQK